MSVFGKDSEFSQNRDSGQKKRPQRVDYNIDGDKGKTSRPQERVKRVDYTYSAKSSVTETPLPIEAQQPQQTPPVQEKPHAKAFDQNAVPVVKPPKKQGGMQQTIIPLGTVNIPLKVVDGKKRTQPQQAPRPAKPPMPQSTAAKQQPQNKKRPPEARQSSAAAQKQPRPAKPPKQAAKRAQPAQKAEPKPLSYGDARRRRTRRSIIAAIAAFVLIMAGIIVSVTVVFKIDTINVVGESIYTNEQIISACGFNYGDNLFKFSLDSASSTVETQLPYLETVTIRRHLPGTVQINVTQAAETYSLNTDLGWAVLSSNFKVLRIDAEPASGLTLIFGTTADAPTVGQTVALTDPDQMNALQTITACAAKYSLAPVNEIDLTNLLEITVLYDNRIRILFGTINDIENKMDYAQNIVVPDTLAESLSANERGSLDVSGRNSEGRMVAVWLAGEP